MPYRARLLIFCLGVLAALGPAPTVSAAPFTYQGRLNESGSPAQGVYDLAFALFESDDAKAIPIGTPLAFEDVPVEGGLFQVELDFGDVFDGSARWISIAVRAGESGGKYTILSPRQMVSAAPEAQHATIADALTVPQWTDAPGVLTYGDGLARVLVNRDTPIAKTEYFGVHGEAADFVGMFVSGPVDAFPYYGYSVDGSSDTLSYFDANTGWHLLTAGKTDLSVNSEHDVVVTNSAKANAFEFNAPRVCYTSVSGNVFHSGSDDPFFVSGGTGGAYISQPGSGWLAAPVDLPDGARVTSMTAYCGDEAVGWMSVALSYQAHNETFFHSICSVSTEGFTGNALAITDDKPSNGTINHQTRHYHIRVFSSSWPGNSTMRLSSVVIQYEIDEAR